MSFVAASPAAVIWDDGELGDVRALLQELGVRILDGQPGAPPPADVALVVATPGRAADLRGWTDAASEQAGPVRLVVQDWGQRGELARGDFELLLRRPFHPSTLRVLLLQALYRGPERRREERVGAGLPVRFRAGFWRRSASLVEFSRNGCRLVTEHAVKSNQRLTVFLPPELSGGAELAIPGRAVRFASGEGASFRQQVVGVEFDALPGPAWERLRAAVERRKQELTSLPDTVLDAGVRQQQGSEAPSRFPHVRAHPRRRYSRRVIALGDSITRVLVGRDLSPGGIRAEPTPHLRLGDEVRLAIHVRRGQEPLVVQARVERDDGERGLVLLFQDASSAARDYLRKMLEDLPVADAARPVEGDEGRVMAEIVEPRSD